MNIYILNIFHAKLFGKLVLVCDDETLNTTESSLGDEKLRREKISCLIDTITLVFIWLLLLVVICVSSYLYYKKYRPKHDHLLLFHNKQKIKRNWC